MSKIRSVFIIAIYILALGQPIFAGDPCTDYSKEPPFLSENALPSTTLIIDFSGSMNEHAYQEFAIKWDNGTSNSTGFTGFDSTKEYYGYFDPDSYYEYSSEMFRNSTSSSSSWSGNFLNWVTMHRIDIMRKAMTGGKYDPYNATHGTFAISKTDGLGARGKFHVFNATGTVTDLNDPELDVYVSPSGFRTLLGFEQGNSTNNLNVYEMTETSSEPKTYKPVSLLGTFKLELFAEKEMGILDLIGPSTRLALFTYDDQGNADQGARALHYMTDNATSIISTINSKDVSESPGWSPLAEGLYTVCGYIQQNAASDDPGPRYKEADSYELTTKNDQFYFSINSTHGSLIHCTQQNIIIVSDGQSTHDQDIPSWLINSQYDKSSNDDIVLDNSGSGYLENVAYWAHTTDLRPKNGSELSGNQTANIYTIALYSSNSTLLKETAKWGGFKDFDGDGLVDENDWDNDGDGVPDNFFDVTSGPELEDALAITMNALTNRASAGGSASVVSTSRKGEGLLYQAVFWPEFIDGKGDKISWTGDVYAYWLDDAGLLYEDDGDDPKRLDNEDSRISLWYDDSDPANERTRACSNGTVIDGQCVNGTAKELTSVKHVWSASEWLNRVSVPKDQRSGYKTVTDGTDVNSKRFITTWIDSDNDGKVDSGEYDSFDEDNDDLKKIVDSSTINWIRGFDQDSLRSRQAYVDGKNVTWRLGDVINSSPTIVAAPAENYDLYWKDSSYTAFYNKYKNRRIMAYFGANDGMLHAVNSGFYDEKEKKYYNSVAENGTLFHDPEAIELGAEMWAYVPYNLLPHLDCLTRKNYQHQYYVDLKPRVFDVKVFDPNHEDHPGGWGTILVSGFNFGGDGSQKLSSVVDLEYSKTRYFGSSYFIFNITNPEKEPEFLGEMSFDGTFTFGFSINTPAVVATKEGNTTYWYLLFGNGPEYTNGGTKEGPTGLVVPLSTLVAGNTANSDFAFRPTNKTGDPSETKMGLIRFGQTLGGSKFAACISTGFVSIDYDLNNFVDMMYYGLVTTNGDVREGGMHRLKVEDRNPSKWAVMKMTETGQPITGAPNAALKDAVGKTGSIWVYFGSGIFWDVAHKTKSATQWIYGIEEPKKAGSYNFSPIDEKSLYDVSNIEVINDGSGELICVPENDCNIPQDVTTVEELADYIQNTPNIDGWKRKLKPRERILGQATLFGGLTNFITFTPSDDACSSEGSSTLYALYYRTGTAWKENVFGEGAGDYVPYTVDLGKGMGITPSLHLGSEEGVRAYIQTSTGSIIEVHQPNLPLPGVKSGMGGWHTINVD